VEYRAVKGSTLTDEQARVYGQRIAELTGGDIKEATESQIVADARKKSSPLHSYFEWNDEIAAEKYRLQQAAKLIRDIGMETKDPKSNEKVVIRAFARVKLEGDKALKGGKHHVVTTNKALANKELREQVIGQALSYIKAWRNKYRLYTELSELFDAIDNFKL
jgi:hypothetical protein